VQRPSANGFTTTLDRAASSPNLAMICVAGSLPNEGAITRKVGALQLAGIVQACALR
jgi:hypothetical protein